MSDEEGGEGDSKLKDYLLKTIERRAYRDTIYLRNVKLETMTLLVPNFRNWIYTEVKELLTTIEKLKAATSHPTCIVRLQQIELSIREIEKTYTKKAINPMKRLAAGRAGSKTEEEHTDMFKTAFENTWRIIVQLRGFRYELDVMVQSVTGLNMSNESKATRSSARLWT